MELNPDLLQIGTNLANVIGKNSVQTIWDRIKVAKENRNKESGLNDLEEIINELISDKHELIQIVRTFEEQLIAQTISDKDIDFITESVVPIVERLVEVTSTEEESAKTQEFLDLLKPIMSKETFKILQLIGFNFKQAVGEPLTQYVKAQIESKMPATDELSIRHQMLVEQRQAEFFKIIQDEEAYNRLLEINGK